jgi:AcrR family transcriptional regulator
MDTMTASDTENPGDLTPEQLRALVALLEHGDKAKAARAAKVSRSTLYRWLRDDAIFQVALEAATRQALREFSTTLVRLAQKAAQALDDALDSGQEIHHRLRAADIVTGRLLAVRELVDLEERLSRLEAQYAKTT